MARPLRKGLSYFTMDVDYFDDEKIFALMEAYGPLGSVVFENLLSMVYRQGYYLEIPIDRLAAQISRRIGCRWFESTEQIRDIIHYCAQLKLLDSDLLRQGIVTSRGIQRRYAHVTVRRKRDAREYWLLEDETDEAHAVNETETGINVTETEVDAAETGVTADDNAANKTIQNNTREKNTKENDSIPYKTTSTLCGIAAEEINREVMEEYERKIKQLSISERIRLDRLCIQYGGERVKLAINASEKQGVHNLRYIEAVLERNYALPLRCSEAAENGMADGYNHLVEINGEPVDIMALMEDDDYYDD